MNDRNLIELLNSGFEPELISFEFNIPIEKLNMLIEQEQSNKKSTEITNAAVTKTSSNMDKLRSNYNKLYTSTTQKENHISVPKATKSQTNLITQTTETISNLFENYESKTENEKVKIVIESLKALEKILDIPITIEQGKALISIFPSSSNVPEAAMHVKNHNYDKSIIKLYYNYSKAIDGELSHINDMETLKKLSSSLPASMKRKNIYIDAIDRKLNSKIQNIFRANALSKLRNNISSNIDSVITSLANGTCDIEKAKTYINEEIKQRISTSPKGRFALTESQQERTVIHQIRTALSEKSELYPITDAQTTMDLLYQLSFEKEHNLKCVSENLIARKKYADAQKFIGKYIDTSYRRTEQSALAKAAEKKQKDIIIAEIGDMILGRIKSTPDKHEDAVFLNLLEQKLKEQKISKIIIKLGKNEEQSKDITLEDIWYENKKIK